MKKICTCEKTHHLHDGKATLTEPETHGPDCLLDKAWREWDGDYTKVFYDVLLKDGTIVKWVWPNAGKMVHSFQTNEPVVQNEILAIRVSPDHPLD